MNRREVGRRVVFWDFDGTLARRDGMWAGALVDALALLGPTDVTADDLRPHLRGGFPWHRPEVVVGPLEATAWWRRLSARLIGAYRAVGVDPDTATAATALVGEQYYRLDAWQLIDGARPALQLVQAAGYTNVVLSNHGPELPELVTTLGLGDLIATVITSALVGAEKPNPMIFEHARTVSGAGADCWMIGDNPIADVAGAESVGIRAVLADGVYPDARGMTVLRAAEHVVGTGARGA
ncbi:HAD family hydrolase [Microlunatus soli]|uniref:Putative hydrolase of the HAD superfamily n=1 Tax=Microlunatus soli TaxID=630515 RepID=A0A1H1R318_9ACTN|nr:HAD-IA family hydrolase [Microlunatus soli]SDS30020.1 putative hydrolase of the HAD superfamily [Microlunatus soli]